MRKLKDVSSDRPRRQATIVANHPGDIQSRCVPRHPLLSGCPTASAPHRHVPLVAEHLGGVVFRAREGERVLGTQVHPEPGTWCMNRNEQGVGRR